MTMKTKFKYIVCIVVYRNYNDLVTCLNTLYLIDNYRIIIINNFYDNNTKNKIKQVADKYNCDFINQENKGYGAGNNTGIKYALDNYDFEYLIISNPDIQIKKFLNHEDVNNVYAPIIRTTRGKNQNPYWYIYNPVAEYMLYIGMKYNINILCLFAWGMNKLFREIFLYNNKKSERYSLIYACHGAFFVIGKKALEKIVPLYDENMFLFSEEALLAQKLKKAGIKIFLDQKVEIMHSEDGSMSLGTISIKEEEKKSYIYYYENRKNINANED